MNLTGSLESVDLTTLARVTTQINASSSRGGANCNYEEAISDISARMTQYLGYHTLKAARVETYEMDLASTVLTLDARPLDLTATFELRVGSSSVDADLDALGEEAATTYRTSAPGGWVRLDRGTTFSSPSWARVTYTGGLGLTADAVITAFPDIARACALQVKYDSQRGDSLSGSLSQIGGGGTVRIGEYGLLREVTETLDVHRRHYN